MLRRTNWKDTEMTYEDQHVIDRAIGFVANALLLVAPLAKPMALCHKPRLVFEGRS